MGKIRMSIASSYLLYLALFRLTIIVTGALIIFWGYRLFLKGIFPSDASGGGAHMEAAAGSYRLTFQNAAPGTFFALFGAVIIGANFYQGGPSLTLKTLAEAVKFPEQEQARENGQPSGEKHLVEIAMKGSAPISTIKGLTDTGKRYERERDVMRARQAYQEALVIIAEPMNNLANLYLQDGLVEEAKRLANLAVQLAPAESHFLHTYAEALHAVSDVEQAIITMEQAARINPEYEQDLRRLRDQAGE